MWRCGKFVRFFQTVKDLCRRDAPLRNHCHPLIHFRGITFLAAGGTHAAFAKPICDNRMTGAGAKPR
jgi:hypothetical protein